MQKKLFWNQKGVSEWQSVLLPITITLGVLWIAEVHASGGATVQWNYPRQGKGL